MHTYFCYFISCRSGCENVRWLDLCPVTVLGHPKSVNCTPIDFTSASREKRKLDEMMHGKKRKDNK